MLCLAYPRVALRNDVRAFAPEVLVVVDCWQDCRPAWSAHDLIAGPCSGCYGVGEGREEDGDGCGEVLVDVLVGERMVVGCAGRWVYHLDGFYEVLERTSMSMGVVAVCLLRNVSVWLYRETNVCFAVLRTEWVYGCVEDRKCIE